MELARLGRKGQLSIPKSVLKRLGIDGETLLAVDVTDDGSILLRQVGVYPLEVYSDARVAEFEEADNMSPEEAEKVTAQRD
jgi:AbrB family looped-hinge helix DNA binding protein